MDGATVAYLDRRLLTRLGVSDLLAFGDVGNRIVEGMLEQVQPIVFPKLALYGVSMPDGLILPIAGEDILVHVGEVRHANVCAEQVGGEASVDLSRDPTLTEIEVQVGERYGRRDSRTECRETLLCHLVPRVIEQPCVDPFGLLDHIARDELIRDLVGVCERIEEDAPLECGEDVALFHVGQQGGHVG